jgi:glutathione S-transferase
MNALQDFTLNLTRFIRAPRERVFDAFVDEAVLPRWHCPRGMSVESATVDARVDGAWRIEMRTRENASHAVGGRYREIRRAERLVYTWVWEQSMEGMAGIQTLIEIDFVPMDGGTEIRMRHSGFPAEAARDGHGQGWNSVFNRLNDLLDERGTAGTIVLLGEPASSYVRSARIGLAEKGVAYTLQRAAPHSPEINAIHPFGKMPAFRDGTTELWETSAILRYIDEGFDGPSLNPGMVVDRARTEEWVSAVGAYMYDAMVRRYVLQYVFPRGEGGTPDRAVIDKAVPEMVCPLDALERCYQGRDFIGGMAPSYADILVTPILDYLGRFPEGGQLLSDRPNIRRALDIMRARPSFAAATAPHDPSPAAQAR